MPVLEALSFVKGTMCMYMSNRTPIIINKYFMNSHSIDNTVDSLILVISRDAGHV